MAEEMVTLSREALDKIVREACETAVKAAVTQAPVEEALPEWVVSQQEAAQAPEGSFFTDVILPNIQAKGAKNEALASQASDGTRKAAFEGAKALLAEGKSPSEARKRLRMTLRENGMDPAIARAVAARAVTQAK